MALRLDDKKAVVEEVSAIAAKAHSAVAAEYRGLSVEKLTELNLQTARNGLSDSANHAQSLMGAKDLQEVVSLQSASLQPLAEKAVAYSRQLADIATGMSTELSKYAESQAADVQKQFVSTVETAMKNAPQGSESAVAAVKNVVSSASAAMESVQKAVKQATDLAEANFNAVAATATKSVKAGKVA